MTSEVYTPDRPLKIGTRGSPLALAQAHETRRRLMDAHDMPEEAFAITVITTTGDAVQDRPLSEIGGKGLFTKEIEAALMDGRIDLAVHSTKDVANTLPDGLVLSTYLPREDVRDSFISRKHASIADLPQGAVVGCSSIRRRAQLLALRPDVSFVEFRGNVQTRLRKLDDGLAEATFLACAGLQRLNEPDLINPVPVDVMLPAVAQGAISLEQREGDEGVSALIAPLNHADTALCVRVERAMLAELDGSCRTPIGGLATLEGGDVVLRGEIVRPDGKISHSDEWRAPRADAVAMGASAGRILKERAGPGFLA
ncbi:hydroxymethylbilane synthase [Pontivivens insulae]|uniref:Porphobilinogen deaminase n=1 Tax=Pontivivens insulae TaxID=1639689 RepID=A0A2R8A8K6_9RHOB|nr:hydroxymethylbilane synthase [Pontivivens insulae]RED18666.1 hydroxymethylbilane synthase [Pontivivens insulae]SPF28564.1 Porphobilinogen deaminase [Pontivivens insulae]